VELVALAYRGPTQLTTTVDELTITRALLINR